MSRLIDKLNRLSKSETQPIGFRTAAPVSSRPRLQLIASLAQDGAENLAEGTVGADAGLLGISKAASGSKSLQKVTKAVSDIPWGAWLQKPNSVEDIEKLLKAGCDFVVFAAADTPLAILQNNDVGKILEVESSLGEGLTRAVNKLPIDAVLISREQPANQVLTWQDLLLFNRFASLLTNPLLVSIPVTVTAGELQALWGAGISGVVVEINAAQPKDRLRELRQTIDSLVFPPLRKPEKIEPVLPRIGQRPDLSAEEEEEEEEDE